MGERATGGGLGAAAMSVREALFSRRFVPRSLNRSPGLERRCTGLTWAPEGAFVDRTIFGAPQGRKKLPARGGYPARPACGWEAGRHLVPQLRRGTTLRPFPDRQHARPPLRPRPFGPIVRAILSRTGRTPGSPATRPAHSYGVRFRVSGPPGPGPMGGGRLLSGKDTAPRQRLCLPSATVRS